MKNRIEKKEFKNLLEILNFNCIYVYTTNYCKLHSVLAPELGTNPRQSSGFLWELMRLFPVAFPSNSVFIVTYVAALLHIANTF